MAVVGVGGARGERPGRGAKCELHKTGSKSNTQEGVIVLRGCKFGMGYRTWDVCVVCGVLACVAVECSA